jgi:hypothetical protein
MVSPRKSCHELIVKIANSNSWIGTWVPAWIWTLWTLAGLGMCCHIPGLPAELVKVQIKTFDRSECM